MAISSNFNDSFCMFSFSCCSSCLLHHQYSKHVSCTEKLVLVSIGCQSRKRKSMNVSLRQPCFSIMGNLPPTTIPIQMETWKWVGFNKHSAPVWNCIYLNDQHLYRLVNLEGKYEVQRSCGQGGGSLVNLCMMSRFISPSKRSQQCGLMPMFCITSLLPSRPHFLRDRALSLLGIFIMFHLASLYW